jgi:hypothetical protein
MNESTLTQLKIIVERAVRPVRASLNRKRAMREELLAHVCSVFEQELARLADGPGALARTQERFGQAAELTEQLQTSVATSDWLDRFVEYFVDPRLGESTLVRAVRNSLITLVLWTSALLPALISQGRLEEWPIIPAAAGLAFGFSFMNSWMRNALYGPSGRSWLRAFLVSCASALLIPVMTFGLCMIYTGEPWSSMMTMLQPARLGMPLLVWGVLLTWVPVATTAYLTERSLRYRREWDNLQII